MNKEEIDNLLKRLSYCEEEYLQNGYLSVGKFNAIKQAINLISKLQKENEELKEDKKALINGYLDTSDILNKRINCLFELLQQEGYLKFDNREQAIDYIDKLIKAGEENENR